MLDIEGLVMDLSSTGEKDRLLPDQPGYDEGLQRMEEREMEDQGAGGMCVTKPSALKN